MVQAQESPSAGEDAAQRKEFDAMSLEDLCVNTIRTLSMDAVQKANSGHPGAPMALAPIAYLLWAKAMRYNPKNPAWFDRDRFVLSCGHASMLLYSVLHLSGYDLSLDDLQRFRQWESKTPGHPEYGATPGVETTTGPLGQGIMNAVGMAMAEAHMAAVYNRAGHEIVHHYTYALCSDGDLMEGASHEAASLAGHLGLGKLICIYDDNKITIDGGTELSFSDDAVRRFEGYGWHVQDLGDRANDLPAMEKALEAARAERGKPSLVIIRSHIGFGSPNKQDTADAHGAPLGEEEVRLTKQALGWPADEAFLVPERVRSHMREAGARGAKIEEEWNARFVAYKKAHPGLAAQFKAALAGELPKGWEESIPVFLPEDGALASRAASGKVLNAVAEKIPWLIGGSADLAPSNNSLLKVSGDFAKGAWANRNLRWGVREHVMCAASSGMALHGGLRPYCATFFVFTDYARPAIRLAALMGLPVIYVMTHDSIGLGEDGPTHQPVEHLAALRAIPNLCVIRPADANETACAWRVAIERREGPTMLVLSRQGLPTLDRAQVAGAEGLRRGAYVLAEAEGGAPDVILIASGSEVSLLLEAKERLAAEGTRARVVSMPCWELFREQDAAYRESVLPAGAAARLGVEAGVSLGWREWIGDGGDFIGIDRFGASAPAKENFKQFGFTADNVAARAKYLTGK